MWNGSSRVTCEFLGEIPRTNLVWVRIPLSSPLKPRLLTTIPSPHTLINPQSLKTDTLMLSYIKKSSRIRHHNSFIIQKEILPQWMQKSTGGLLYIKIESNTKYSSQEVISFLQKVTFRMLIYFRCCIKNMYICSHMKVMFLPLNRCMLYDAFEGKELWRFLSSASS